MKKKLLFLGGSFFQVPAIIRAKELGYYVITADYLPSNPGHKFGDEYHNVSTTNKVEILTLAQNLKVDGVIAYASDPAAVVAAFVSSKLGLPSSSLESVEILGEKHLWNKFLRDHDFQVPGFVYGENIEKTDINHLKLPLIIKPVDSSGSKGISRLNQISDLEEALTYAQSFSRSKMVIVEEYIEMDGFLIGGDGFFGSDQLDFVCYGDVYANVDLNPLVPSGFSIPSRLGQDTLDKISKEITRLLKLLKVKNMSFNLEVMIDRENKIYLKEMGPRNGGYFVPQLIEYYTRVNMVDLALKSAMESDFKPDKSDLKYDETNGYYYGFHVLHSEIEGYFDKITYSLPSEMEILEEHVFVAPGDSVYEFTGSNRALGVVIFLFKDYSTMNSFYGNIKSHINICLKK